MPFWRLRLTKVSYRDQMHFSNESRGNRGSAGGAARDSSSARRLHILGVHNNVTLEKDVGSNQVCPDKAAFLHFYHAFNI